MRKGITKVVHLTPLMNNLLKLLHPPSPSLSPAQLTPNRVGTAASRQTYVDSKDSNSDVSVVVPKVNNRTPHSKPSSSGPSAPRIVAQNKKTVKPEFGLKASNVYKRSDSPTYSITSSGVSECHSDHDGDDDSDVTFEGFEPLTKEDQEKLTKLGKLRTIEYGLKKRKQVRSYICHEGRCTFVGKSIQELNEHHIKLHQDMLCEVCNKSFKTPSSLKRHSYSHGELKFACNQCNEAFAFQSELNFHKTIHRKIPTFKCMSKNCDKVYKSANELNKHVLKHSAMVWNCAEKNCDYSTDDRRNLRAHKRKHQNIGSFKCVPCDKHFKYFMQLKRHKVTPDCKAQRAN